MKFTIRKITFILLLTNVILVNNLFSQTYQKLINELLGQNDGRVITTAVPFLLISPDARAGAVSYTHLTLPTILRV